MVSWPEPGTRVTVRYRRPAGSVPPLTDAIGHLLAVDPVVRVQTKTGAIVEFTPADAVALRVLTDTPVRTSDIRALEHAAAMAWPGLEQSWLDGWLLRAGCGVTNAANSALPLDLSAHQDSLPAVAAWYAARGLVPRLAIPDRLLRAPPGWASQRTHRVLVRDVAARVSDDSVILSVRPDESWLRSQRREVPVDMLTAVVDGEVVFGAGQSGAIARAAVTDAPDGARWVGLSAVRAPSRRSGAQLCEALLSWGARRGATRGYLYLDDSAATGPAESLGFRLHHRTRYFLARPPDNL
jgi:N-acetylglutamate synthase